MSEFLDLNKFIKQDQIGEGAFGEVFKVLEKGTNNIFAAKILNTELDLEDTKVITDIKREVNILSQLRHPSVLRFIGYSPINFDQESSPVIISEYLPNQSLADLIKNDRKLSAPKTWTDTKKLINIYGIASAMKYLHSHHILHRDLKPANILEDENLFPKIADFGLSKSYKKSDTSESKMNEGFKGTPAYISPEIWRDCDYTEAGDVYAFAIIVYELLTLDEPYEGKSFFYLMTKVAMEGERPEFKYPLPDCYTDLIKRCWSSNLKRRPTFNRIVEELRTNEEFLIHTIDRKEFFDYVDYVDHIGSSFDKNKKLKTIGISKKNSGENENNESSEKNDEITVTVKEFNNLPLKSQELTISRIIESESDDDISESLLSFNKLLNYLNQMKPKTDLKYVSIPTKEEEITIEEFFEQKSKISLLYDALEMINEHLKSNLTEIFSYLDKFNRIHIEIKYPTNVFDSIYEQVLKAKAKYGGKILINIFISGIDKTDMKFRNNKNIGSIKIDNNVHQITGGQLQLFTENGGSFSSCSLERVSIGSSVTSIQEASFCSCSSLTQITIPSSVTIIETGAFCICESLTQFLFELPSSVTSIGSYAFFGCSSLTQFIIPSSVTKIDEYCFSKCSSLTQITIPSSVTKIGKNSFAECSSLTQITIPSSVTKIENNTFYKCSLLRVISIPSSVTSIGEYAFSECSSLIQITIPSSVTSIENYVFERCISLAQVTIPSSVTSIKDSSFLLCSSLTQVTIPSSVTEIGDYAFLGCSSLTQITIPSSVTSIGNNTFSSCSSLTQITIPSSITSIGDHVFSGCSSLAQITIPSSVASIGNYAFSGCSSLTQMTIPSSVASIGKSAFDECSALTQISILSSITDIRNYAFSGCSSLTQITIPSSVTKISYYAFRKCSSLTQITIPSSVTEIEHNAFSECSSLTQITIPNFVTSIGDYAFSKCSSLTQVTILSSVAKFGIFIFNECISLKKAYLHSSINSNQLAFPPNVEVIKV